VFGFFQLSFFPATLTIFSHHFNVKQDGKLVGIWSSKSNAGNIVGFLMSNLFVYNFHIQWEYTMLICSVVLIFVCLMLWKFVPNPEFESENKINTKKFIKFFKKTWSQKEFKLYIMSFSLFKAILYSYELWTPKFLADNGFKDYSGYVPMLFDIFTLFGSFVMGIVYQK
jgi:MFS family permease